MSEKLVQIFFEGMESWEKNREEVDKIIEEVTGTSDYPSTKSLPPVIFRVNLTEDGIKRLRGLGGIIVRVSEEDDD